MNHTGLKTYFCYSFSAPLSISQLKWLFFTKKIKKFKWLWRVKLSDTSEKKNIFINQLRDLFDSCFFISRVYLSKIFTSSWLFFLHCQRFNHFDAWMMMACIGKGRPNPEFNLIDASLCCAQMSDIMELWFVIPNLFFSNTFIIKILCMKFDSLICILVTNKGKRVRGN